MFKETERQGLVVFINNSHVLRRLRRYGHIMYVSKRMHYVILYVNRTAVLDIKEELLKLHNVVSVKLSEWPNIDQTVFRLADKDTFKKTDEDD